MSVFADAVRERVRQARADIEAALAAGDAHGAELAREELEDALRLAARHNIRIETEDEVSDQ
ncbi:hypothetical protein GCM10020367_49970 [Streptomyces sannanensis]|uniref:Uncharacterized protein n=1 Tax=Streptomyces sannanensis TaxID=285536 RepID=A0ABP6SIK3_9ACTN